MKANRPERTEGCHICGQQYLADIQDSLKLYLPAERPPDASMSPKSSDTAILADNNIFRFGCKQAIRLILLGSFCQSLPILTTYSLLPTFAAQKTPLRLRAGKAP